MIKKLEKHIYIYIMRHCKNNKLSVVICYNLNNLL